MPLWAGVCTTTGIRAGGGVRAVGRWGDTGADKGKGEIQRVFQGGDAVSVDNFVDILRPSGAKVPACGCFRVS